MMNNQKGDVRGSISTSKLNSSKEFNKSSKRQLNDINNPYGNSKLVLKY